MAYLDSTTNSGTTTDTPNTAVPAGVQADDIVILAASYDDSSGDFAVGDWPTGFTEMSEVALGPDGGRAAIGWKRLTGADSGSYTFGAIGGSAPDWVCQAFAFRGRHTTNPPVLTATNNTSLNGTPVTATVPSVTAVAGDDMLAICIPDVNSVGAFNVYTSRPSGYTVAETDELGFANGAGDYLNNVSAGATGTKTYVFTLTGGQAGWWASHIRIPAAAAASDTQEWLSRISDNPHRTINIAY